MLFQFRMSEGKFIQRLTYGRSLNRHCGLLGGELTQGGRDVNLHSSNSLFLIWLRSAGITGPAVNSVRAAREFPRLQTACHLRPFRPERRSWSAWLRPVPRW